MNKIIFVVGILATIFLVAISLQTDLNLTTNPKEECDKLLHKNVEWGICYKKGEIITTIQRGNIYEATKTRKCDYDKVEVYDRIDGSVVIATYEGRLYFDVKARCK